MTGAGREREREREKEARLVSLQAASCPMRRRALPALISSKAQSEGEQEGGGREGGRDMEERRKR